MRPSPCSIIRDSLEFCKMSLGVVRAGVIWERTSEEGVGCLRSLYRFLKGSERFIGCHEALGGREGELQ